MASDLEVPILNQATSRQAVNQSTGSLLIDGAIRSTRSQRSMIDFVILSSHLWLKVLDTWAKRGAELSADHHLVVT